MFTLQSNQIANALRLADVPDASAKDLVQAFTNCSQYLEQRGPVGLTYSPANSGLFPTQQPSPWGVNPNSGGNSTVVNRNVTVNIPPWQNIPFTPLPFVDIPAGTPYGFGDGGYVWPGYDPTLTVPGPVTTGPIETGPITSPGGTIGGNDFGGGGFSSPGDTYVGGATYVGGDTYVGGATNTTNMNVAGDTQLIGNVITQGDVTNETTTNNYGDTNNYGNTFVDGSVTITNGPTKIYGPTTINNMPLNRQKVVILTNLALEGTTLKATRAVLTYFGKLSIGEKQTVFTINTDSKTFPTTFDPESCELGGDTTVDYVSGLTGS